MEKLKLIFKLSYKFSNKFYKDYFLQIAKPLLIGGVGLFVMLLIQLDPIFAFLGLFITLPCIFYSFWRGYFITYALNDVSYNFLKGTNCALLDSLEKLKNQEKDFIKYVSFCAILSVIGYIPSIFYFLANLQINVLIADPYSILSNLGSFILVFALNTIILSPFLNFMTQAYYFKQKSDNYFKIIANCYKYLDFRGIVIILIIGLFNLAISNIHPLIYAILALIGNLFIYSINTFWFYTKINKK